MSHTIYREQITSLTGKSIFVLVEQAGAVRLFEATGVPLAADAETYLAANYTEAAAFAAGNANFSPADTAALSIGRADATTTGLKVVGVVGKPGFIFLPEFYRIGVIDSAGVTKVPTASLGTNSPTYNDLQPATALTGWAAPNMQNFFLSTKMNAVLAVTPIFINITVAAVATRYVLAAEFIGEYRKIEGSLVQLSMSVF